MKALLLIFKISKLFFFSVVSFGVMIDLVVYLYPCFLVLHRSFS